MWFVGLRDEEVKDLWLVASLDCPDLKTEPQNMGLPRGFLDSAHI